jgi:hypothetical protein
MSHLSEDDLVLLHYREDAGSEAEAHLAGCAACADRLRALGRTLALLRAPEAPERGEDYGARVWARLRPGLELREARPKVVPIRGRLWPRAVSVAALAAAVGDHLERSQMVLVELVNAPVDEAMNVKAQRALANELVSANRLYRQTAARSGEPALTAVLEELERVLVEVAAGPDALTPDDLAELQRRIESRGLLFRVRVIGTQVREREKELPRTSSSS